MAANYLFWTMVLLLMSAYVAVSVWKRHQAEDARWRAQRRIGSAFDVTNITPQVERVKGDYLPTVHHQGIGARSRRAELVASTRRMVSRLSYFCLRDNEEQRRSEA